MASILKAWAYDKSRVTPPLLTHYAESDCIHVAGGNHRFAVADAARAPRVPAYVRCTDVAEFRRLVPTAQDVPAEAVEDLGSWDELFK